MAHGARRVWQNLLDMLRKFFTGALRAGAVLGATVVVSAQLLACPAPAGATGPAVPAGTSRAALARPSVYPGGGVYPFGDAEVGAPKVASVNGAGPTFNSLVVDMVATNDGTGYWLASADGGVYNYGTAQYYGSLGNLTLQGPIVGMAATPDDRGYWLIGFDGGIFAFGDARFYGSMGGSHLNLPIVGMAATPDGGGYWMVADDGGIFAFGDARFYGSTGSMTLAANIVAMAPTPDGGGYWLVGADGGIFAFGDAGYLGSMGGKPLNDGILSMAPTPDGQGYWLVAWDGGVFTFGDATYAGSLGGGGPAAPVTKLVPTPDGDGYWLLGPDAFNYSFDNPPPNGTFPGSAAIVAAAESQVQPDPSGGGFCNPYGPCEEWCALFATWAMEQGGVGIPSYAFTGDIYDWGAANGTVLPPSAVPVPGDDLLYGSGPASTATSLHTGIVAQVWPDGAIITIEGDAGPGIGENLAVIINGPFRPVDSDWYNGFGIYAYVQP